MIPRFSAWLLLFILGCGLLVAPADRARAAHILFRISVENDSNHIQARAVRRFAEELAEKTKGVLRVEFRDNASMFRDKDVFSALSEGKVEMAVPGTWHVARFVPDVGMFLLPYFYGRSAEDTHAVLASDVGEELNKRVEDFLGVAVPGHWLDLGHAHLYTLDRKLESFWDIDGLKMRVAGGRANEMRLEYAGARVVSIAWPDFPLWLDNREVDGVLTTHETVRSAALWNNGLSYCLEDGEYFPMYVPMIASRVWRHLPQDVRSLIVDIWNGSAAWEREMALKAQQDARQDLVANGMTIVTPDKDEIRAWRSRLMEMQDEMISLLGVDAALYARAMHVLGK